MQGQVPPSQNQRENAETPAKEIAWKEDHTEESTHHSTLVNATSHLHESAM